MIILRFSEILKKKITSRLPRSRNLIVLAVSMLLLCGAPVQAADPLLSDDPLTESLILPEIKADHPAVSPPHVMIDVGHGGVDGGTVHGEVLEKDLNLAAARITYETMRQQGLQVLLNRVGDYALSSENQWLNSRSRHIKDLAQRAHLANEVSPGMLLSLHVNSAGSSSRRGPIVIHQRNPQSKRLAQCLQEALNPLYGSTTKPVSGRTYYLLKHTKVPAVIVELGFITNSQDRALLQSPEFRQAIADKLTQGVLKFLEGSGGPTE